MAKVCIPSEVNPGNIVIREEWEIYDSTQQREQDIHKCGEALSTTAVNKDAGCFFTVFKRWPIPMKSTGMNQLGFHMRIGESGSYSFAFSFTTHHDIKHKKGSESFVIVDSGWLWKLA